MSYYKIEIKCTSNVDKAGKLIVKNESDTVVLESDVVLPKSFHGQDKELRGLEVEKFIPEKYSKNNNIANINNFRISRMESFLSSHFIKTSSNHSILIVGSSNCKSEGKELKGFDEIITMPKDTFTDLKKIISNPNNDISLSIKNKWFMFGQKEASRSYDVDFNEYRKLGKDIASEEIKVEEKIKEEQEKKILKELQLKNEATKQVKKDSFNTVPDAKLVKTTVNTQKKEPVFSTLKQPQSNNDLYAFDIMLKELRLKNEATKQVKKDSFNTVPDAKLVKTTVNTQKKEPVFSTLKQPQAKNLSSNNTSSIYRSRTNNQLHQSNNDLDAFDIMLMTSFPDLAPMFRPNSALAWMIYMNNQNNHNEFIERSIDCIRNIQGFENVVSCDISIKNQGTDSESYKINLYQDENKNIPLGTVNYNPEKGLIMKDENGNQTFVSEMKNKQGYTVLTEGENNSKALIEVVQNKNNDFIGNWTIEPQNSIPVSSSVVITENLNMSSDTNKTFNMENVNVNTIDTGSVFKKSQDFNIKEYINNKWDNKEEYVPPPPPPPPPEDYNSPTSDPYARTGFSI